MSVREQPAYIRFDTRCANVECTNKPGEGPFVIVTLGRGNVVGGHRPLRMFLCSPCADALDHVIAGGGS
jgi:hypothetical protein